jgi:hypothetical protein
MSLKDIKLTDLEKIARKLELSSYGTKKQLYDRINRKLRQTGGRIVPSVNKRKSPKKRQSYFKRGNKLSKPHQKYCRCVLHVADQQSSECLRNKKWGENVNGKRCYNPYSVCTMSTKRTKTPDCTGNLNLNAIPKNELRALLDIKNVTLAQLKNKYNDTK